MLSLKFICFLACMLQMAFGTTETNVLKKKLEICSLAPMTGFMRTGKCETNENDQGTHLICATMTDDFLTYTKSKGNDLSTPNAAYSFPGLKQGDNWCICVYRWNQAHDDGHAPKVVLGATNIEALSYLKKFNKTLNDLSR